MEREENLRREEGKVRRPAAIRTLEIERKEDLTWEGGKVSRP